MNKMTEAQIHAVLDGVKEGDEIQIFFREKVEKISGKGIETNSIYLRWQDGTLVDELNHIFSIENFGQPVEPEHCLNGETDYNACMAPFRYCPVKDCGRSENLRLSIGSINYE